MYLDKTIPGRLLEVGCGNGSRLTLLMNHGWDVVGQEIDPIAAKIARSTCHCEILEGELPTLGLKQNSFDAVVMNHVIEHVTDPIALLKECHRILKPCGRLILVTPNSHSLGHQCFRGDWFHLDPPRHLNLFSQKTIETLAIKSGFNITRTFTTAVNAHIAFKASFNFKDYGKITPEPMSTFDIIKIIFLSIVESLTILFRRDIGEECILLGTKSPKNA